MSGRAGRAETALRDAVGSGDRNAPGDPGGNGGDLWPFPPGQSHAFQSFRAGFMRAESTAPAGGRKCGTPGDSAAAAAGGSGNPAAAFGDAAVADAADSHVCTVVSSHQKGGALEWFRRCQSCRAGSDAQLGPEVVIKGEDVGGQVLIEGAAVQDLLGRGHDLIEAHVQRFASVFGSSNSL